MIINFILGGSIFTLIEYIVNHIQNPALAAIISMIPIGYISIFLISDNNIIKNYIKNIISVVLITLIVTIIFFYIIKYLKYINPKILAGIMIVIWIIIQYINYKYNIINNN